MKNRASFSFLAILPSLFYFSSLSAAPADLDDSFGTGGSVVGSYPTGWYEALAVQNDGKIIAVGTVSNSPGSSAMISRYTSAGVLDATFNGDGKDTLSADFGWDVVIQADGKSLVLATSSSDNGNIYVARYNTDGTLDSGFGQSGVVDYDLWMDFNNNLSPTVDEPQAIAVQADGKIIVGGQYTINGTDRRAFLIRMSTDGSVDRTFGPAYAGAGESKGYRIDYSCTAWTYLTDIALAPNGDLIIAGKCAEVISSKLYYDSYITVYDSEGQNDTHYFTDKSDENFGISDQFESVYVQPDGKIVAAGFGGARDYLIARFNYLGLSDMILDTSFDSDGFSLIDVTDNDRGWGLTIQADGKILIAGYSSSTQVLRLNSDGSLDTTFGSNGNMGVVGDFTKAIIMQPDGAIVFAGSATGTSLNRLAGSPLNTQPTAFSFTDEFNTSLDSVVTSNIVTMLGLAANGEKVPLTILNGEYALNGDTTYSTALIFVEQNDLVNVRHISSSNTATTVDTVLSVGGILPSNSSTPIGLTRTGTFSSTTTDISDATDTAGTSDTAENTEASSSGGGGSMDFFFLVFLSILIMSRLTSLRRHSIK